MSAAERQSLESTAAELHAAARALMAERERLQATATNLDRWQGVTETTIAENNRRLDALNGSIHSIERCQTEIQVTLATIKTKIAMWSGVGGLAAGGIVTAVIGSGLGQ